MTVKRRSRSCGACAVLRFFGTGVSDGAFSAIERTPEHLRDMRYHVHRAYIVMEIPNRHAEAFADYQAVMQRDLRGYDALQPQLILFLLGRESEARAAARQIGDRYRQMPAWMLEWYRYPLEYVCGQISSGYLLRAAGASRGHLCEAHFWIALDLLAVGERAPAAEHFRQSVATRVFDYFEYIMSRCFLAHLERDPAWPPWIPIKEGTEENAVTTQASSRAGEERP
jgi:lipoprotein NlpI